MAMDVFKRKYSKRTFRISGPFSDEKNENFQESGDFISFQRIELIFKTMQMFGHHISSLRIVYKRLKPHEYEKIHQFITEYCRESLIELEFDAVKRNVLNEFDKPFLSVEKVHFSGELAKFGTKNMNLVEFLPKLRHLSIEQLDIIDRESFQQNLPQLTHLRFGQLSRSGFAAKDIERFIKINAQIQGVRLNYFPIAFLKVLCDNLPNLTSLELPWGVESNRNHLPTHIHFQNVRKFSIKCGPNVIPNVSFHRIERLQLSCHGKISDEWFDFVISNKELIKLKIVYGKISDKQLLRLADELPHLAELSFVCEANINDDTIVEFMERCKGLTKLELNNDAITTSRQFKQNVLTRKVRNWQVSHTSVGALVERGR